MARYRAVVTTQMTTEYLNRLQQICDVKLSGWLVKDGWILNEDETVEVFRNAEILVVGYDVVTKRVLDACPNLKLIACTRGNPVNIDRAAASARRIPIINTPGRNANSVAEFLLGALIGLIRRIPLSFYQIRGGRYLGPPSDDIYRVPQRDDIVWGLSMNQDDNPFKTYEGYELFHRTFGMIGYGAVGRRLSKRWICAWSSTTPISHGKRRRRKAWKCCRWMSSCARATSCPCIAKSPMKPRA